MADEDIGTTERGSSPQMPVLRARAADTDEILRLAALMYQAMGIDASGAVWRQAATDQLRRRLGGEVMVLVVDDPTHSGRLAATGAGVIAERLPGPTNPSARVGYIQWVATDDAWRRHGLARAITIGLLDGFTARQVPSVELHATPEGEPLYRALGFTQGMNPGLRIRIAPTS